MTQFAYTTFAKALADAIVRERFATTYGVETLSDYLNVVDDRQTQHLAPGLAAKTLRATGKQRRRARFKIEGVGEVIVAIPLSKSPNWANGPWAEIELSAWLDLLENGSDGPWFLNYANKADLRGYVRTRPPMGGSGPSNLVTVGRLVAGAGRGRSVRFMDRNPLNLRRSNLFLLGTPPINGKPLRGAKHDARQLVAYGAARRQALAGANFDWKKQ